MRKIAIIGANGFVGSGLYKELSKNKSSQITAVTRKNYSYWKKRKFDIVINSAMPSARFWAKNNPYQDFTETVEKTADIVYGWKYKKLIHVSTISARTELDTVYGRNKASAESLVNSEGNLIVRLTSMYAETLKKGVLIDIINRNKVYVSKKSRYSFASLEFVCAWIANNLDRKGIVEIGAKNSISLEEIVSYLKIPIAFEGKTDIQEVINPEPEFPNAEDVLNFLSKKIKN